MSPLSTENHVVCSAVQNSSKSIVPLPSMSKILITDSISWSDTGAPRRRSSCDSSASSIAPEPSSSISLNSCWHASCNDGAVWCVCVCVFMSGWVGVWVWVCGWVCGEEQY